MRYFIYARKSTDDEDRQILSIEAQIKELREYATRENLSIVKELIEAKTAKKPGRPIFNDMLLQIERGHADGILAWHPDRLARNSVDGGKIIYLVDQGIIKDLRFPTYRFDDNAQGKFMLSIAFGQSKYYIDALSENIKRGIRLKLSKGIWPQWAPIGYINDRKTRTIIIDEGKAPFITKSFALYATGNYALKELRDKINSLGLTGCKNKPMSISQYQHTLKNPIYYGVFRYKGEIYEGTHEPIITKKLFDKCQEVMKARGKPKKSEKHFILRGLMKCGECGRMITAEIQKGHTYYRCTKRYTNCSQKYIREEELSKQVRSILQKVSLCDDWTANILKELEKDKLEAVQSSRPHQQNLRDTIINVDNKINKLIDMYLENSLSLEEYQKAKEKLINEKKTLQESLKDFADGGDNWFEQAKDFVTTLNRIDCVVREGNLESQKEFLEKIGSNFILKERRLVFSTEGTFRPFLQDAPYPNWRCVYRFVRTHFNPLSLRGEGKGEGE
ncbi:MAG: recombinase family protein [Candidatus Omnitrophota bacterium]|nr:recombinase family protein [Candidatus Omnitrophota bacterium]